MYGIYARFVQWAYLVAQVKISFVKVQILSFPCQTILVSVPVVYNG